SNRAVPRQVGNLQTNQTSPLDTSQKQKRPHTLSQRNADRGADELYEDVPVAAGLWHHSVRHTVLQIQVRGSFDWAGVTCTWPLVAPLEQADFCFLVVSSVGVMRLLSCNHWQTLRPSLLCEEDKELIIFYNS